MAKRQEETRNTTESRGLICISYILYFLPQISANSQDFVIVYTILESQALGIGHLKITARDN